MERSSAPQLEVKVEKMGGESGPVPEKPQCLRKVLRATSEPMPLAACEFIESCTFSAQRGAIAELETGNCAVDQAGERGKFLIDLIPTEPTQ